MPTKLRLTIAAGCLCAVAVPALAQQKPAQPPAQPSPPASPPAAAAAPAVSPEIRAAVDRMAKAMQAQQSFELKADATAEEVLDNGQKVQSASVLTASARRPDKLFVEVASERRTRRLYYDGKTVTVFGPVKKYYASVPAPPTTAAMLHDVADRYGLDTPLLDLFEWGSSGVKLDGVTSALYAGPDRIAGQTCDQYAFRQEGVDWQLWIAKAEPALPCKLVIVDTEDPSHPQFSAVFSWKPNAPLSDERFAFTPPGDAHRIAIANTGGPSQQKAAPK